MARIVRCNMCGKDFGFWDEQGSRGIHETLGYESKFDGYIIDLDLCCECFDNVVDMLRPMCKHDFIKEGS